MRLAGQPLFGLDAHSRSSQCLWQSSGKSFETDLSVPVLGEAPFHAFFIRGPVIEAVGPEVEIPGNARRWKLSLLSVKEPYLALHFTPEVAGDPRFHHYFLRIVQSVKS